MRTYQYRRFTAMLSILAVVFGSTPAAMSEEHICRYHHHDHQIDEHHHELELRGEIEATESGRHYAPDRQVDVLHIDLDVTPDFERHTVTGTATLSFSPISQPVTRLQLNAFNLQIDEVSAQGAQVVDHTSSNTALDVQFASPIPVGEQVQLRIKYHCQPAKGLYFRTPDMGYPETDTHVWSQGEPHEARHWFPCFDYPNEKSSTSVTCHVPSGMTVLSNGELKREEVDTQTGLKAVQWHQETPHANYLICLVAGYLEKLEKQHGNVPLAFYTQPSTIKYAASSFADTDSIMAFFDEEIGIPFPWKKYYQVTIVDFMWGGMENTTLTTLTHNTLFDESVENLETTRRLDAHEMAHQWFGDYVTCKDWSHLWLNEGFATFYTHLYEGHKFGNDAKLFGLYGDARGILGNKDTKPIVYKQYADPTEQFDYRAYPKGSWVLHMLRSQLGDDLYRKCIKTYLERRALTSVVTEDLNDVIEELSGRSFDAFFDQWVYHGGEPELKVSYRWLTADKLAHVTVEQTQEINDQVLVFQFPTRLRFWIDGKPVDHEIVVDRKKHEFYVPLEAEPEIVRFDPDVTVLANVTFNKPDKMLLAQLNNAHDTMGRVFAAEELGKRKTREAIDALAKALQNDSFYGVRTTAVSALRGIDDSAAFDALVASREQDDARVRQDVLQAIARKYSPETRRLLQEVIDTEANPKLVANAVRALAAYTGDETRGAVLDVLKRTSFQDELAIAAINSIAATRDSTYAGPLMRELRRRGPGISTNALTSGMDTLARISRDRTDKTPVREFLIDHVHHPRQRVQVAAIRALGELGDPLASPILTTLADDDSGPLGSAASAALGKLDQTQPVAAREIIELRGLVREMQDEQEKLRKQMETLQQKYEAKAEAKAETKEESAK